MGWPDLLSEPMVELVDDVDNSRMLSNSPAVPPLPMQQLFNPMDIRNTTRWCNVAADYEAVLQSTNSQWNNRSHSNFGSKLSRSQQSGEGEFLIAAKRNSIIDESLQQFNLGFCLKRGLNKSHELQGYIKSPGRPN